MWQWISLDVDIVPQIILGARRPSLACEALRTEPSIVAIPCNVVVRSMGPETTLVEAFDSHALTGLAENAEFATIAADAKHRLDAAFAALNEENQWSSTLLR